jgi:hypothetical protein
MLSSIICIKSKINNEKNNAKGKNYCALCKEKPFLKKTLKRLKKFKKNKNLSKLFLDRCNV